MSTDLLPQELQAQLETWLDQLHAPMTLIACNHAPWRTQAIELVGNAFADRQQVVLDLCETQVEDLRQTLDEKLSDYLVQPVLIHIVHLEHSWLEAHAQQRAEAWNPVSESSLARLQAQLILYTDESTARHLAAQAPNWWAQLSDPLTIPSEAAPLLYAELLEAGQAYSVGEPTQALTIADRLAEAGALLVAQQWYEQSLEFVPEQRAAARLGLGELALHRERLDQAQPQLNAALELADDADHALIGRICFALGRLATRLRDWKHGAKRFAEAREFLSPEEHPEEWGEAARLGGRCLEEAGHPDQAIKSYLLAARHWGQHDSYASAAAHAYQQAGALCQGLHRWQEARDHFAAAIPFAEKTEDEFLVTALEDSVSDMEAKVAQHKKGGKKGFFGKLFS